MLGKLVGLLMLMSGLERASCVLLFEMTYAVRRSQAVFYVVSTLFYGLLL